MVLSKEQEPFACLGTEDILPWHRLRELQPSILIEQYSLGNQTNRTAYTWLDWRYPFDPSSAYIKHTFLKDD